MDLEHGGNVGAAALQFDIPREQWLDLSTGISPWTWPVPPLPQSVWQTLPYVDETLERTAAKYFGCNAQAVLAVPGSQYALQHTPALLRRGRVAMPVRGYSEHRAAWQAAGHQVIDYVDATALRALVLAADVDHALLINPNNPTGDVLQRREIAVLQQRLRGNGGWLVVDEAFVDATPPLSVADLCPLPGLIVYRSIGKFFGLAGIRLGFMLAPQELCRALAMGMPPWLVSHPARWIGERALSDTAWQIAQCERLATGASQWRQILQKTVPDVEFSNTALFVTGRGLSVYCRALYEALARRALLVRLFDDIDGQCMIRFGLPLPAVRDRVVQLIREAREDCA